MSLDKKITELDAVTSMNDDDLFAIVSNPTTTPVTNKITKKDAFNITTLTSVAIQAAIDAAETAGGGIVQLGVGTFITTAVINLASNVILQGSGIGATIIKQGASLNNDVILADTITNFMVRGLSIDGNKANNATGDSGIAIYDSNNWTIENVESYGNKLKGFVCVVVAANCEDGTFINCEAHDNDQDGFTWASGLTADGFVCRRVGCINCNSHDNTLYGVGIVTPAATYSRAEDTFVVNCRIVDNGTYGIEIFGAKAPIIQGNIISDNGMHGVDLGSATNAAYKVINAIVSGNICRNSRSGYSGIRVQSSDYHLIYGNVCYDDQGSPTQAYGISGSDGTGGKIYGNTYWGNATSSTDTVTILL